MNEVLRRFLSPGNNPAFDESSQLRAKRGLRKEKERRRFVIYTLYYTSWNEQDAKANEREKKKESWVLEYGSILAESG